MLIFIYIVTHEYTHTRTHTHIQSRTMLVNNRCFTHYSEVIMGTMASQITCLPLFTHPFIQAQIKETIKTLRHWPLCEEFSAYRWTPCTNGQWRGKCFHLMTSSCIFTCFSVMTHYTYRWNRFSSLWIYQTLFPTNNISMINITYIFYTIITS